MQTINNRMTESQIADLFSLAVQLQVKAEESDDRDTAILAYSIQNACSNLTESQREFRAADATIHNLELKLTDMAVQLANAESKCRELAAATPEGYVLVPQQIFLDPSDIESICSQCGDGHESGYGDFTDGLLWVGNIQRDDGSIVHGLHISSADYTEEGGVTICEFAAQLRKGAAL
ncbi:hypothetical protein N5F20_07630 [Citrobacter freundii]|uniref:hypothetical protein n=1 Tax=Citrobacter freundii TaxID=546 RepID=UPI002448F8AE|nr:hypothetical protein [Citrobacter freundii]MDH1410344.1 hypothetical protein [Citrobacter freundii]